MQTIPSRYQCDFETQRIDQLKPPGRRCALRAFHGFRNASVIRLALELLQFVILNARQQCQLG